MASARLTIAVLLIVYGHPSRGNEEVSSPLRVAQCRATCLQTFTHGGESTCLQGPDCFMCWENCELLQSNFHVWGTMCQEKEICFPGCQEACRFHEEAAVKPQQSQPVIPTKGEGVIHVNGALARWPPPASIASSKSPLVYVVMRRSANGPWRQIIQTVSLATRVPHNNNGALLRVLVVDPQGLVTIYSPDESSNKNEMNPKKKKKTINTEIRATTPVSFATEAAEEWSLKEVSLIHQKVLVIGEIAWDPRGVKGLYLVTWEVDGGGLRGNLFTDSTCVTLSLWPDTIYHIQVELVSRMPGIANDKSEKITIDTSRAQRVSTESMEDVKILQDSNKRSTKEDLESVNELYSVIVSSMRKERMVSGEHDTAMVLGVCAGVAFFVVVLVAAAWQYRRHGTFPGTNVYVGDSSVRSRKLVEDFLPARGFQPILTMVSDVPEKRGVSSVTTSPVRNNPGQVDNFQEALHSRRDVQV